MQVALAANDLSTAQRLAADVQVLMCFFSEILHKFFGAYGHVLDHNFSHKLAF